MKLLTAISSQSHKKRVSFLFFNSRGEDFHRWSKDVQSTKPGRMLPRWSIHTLDG